MSTNQQAKTLYEKVYDARCSCSEGQAPILYIDRHLVHKVTSPQAFDGLREKGRKVRQVRQNFCNHGSQRIDTNERHQRFW